MHENVISVHVKLIMFIAVSIFVTILRCCFFIFKGTIFNAGKCSHGLIEKFSALCSLNTTAPLLQLCAKCFAQGLVSSRFLVTDTCLTCR